MYNTREKKKKNPEL